MSEQSVLYCERLRSGDWLISVSLSDYDHRNSMFSEEAATAEIAAQLACRLRQQTGTPAVLLFRELIAGDERMEATLQLVQSAVLDERLQEKMAAVRARDFELVVCDDYLQLRNATSIVSLYGGVLLATYPSNETFMTIIESAEGIALRCSREHDVCRAVDAAAASLGYCVRTSGVLDPEWAQEFIDRISTFLGNVLDLP